MRLLPAIAALSLLAGNVRAQHRDGFGFVDELTPRSWPEALGERAMLAKRDGSCGDGTHPCSDVNSTMCCPNTDYCFVDKTWTIKCCEIGLDCFNHSTCDSEHYYANVTTTTTITASASLTSIATVTLNSVCPGRSCIGSFYGCPSSLGGHCCGFGSNCATDTDGTGVCIGPSGTSSKTTSPLISAIPSGCSIQGQTYCTQGGGCCDAGSVCTHVSSSARCAVAPASTGALPTGATISHPLQGLSTGAKAGIAVGVVVLAALLIGALTYLCLHRRRGRNGGTKTTTTAQELPSVAARTARVHHPSDNGIRPYDAASGPHMSEADGYSYGYAASSNNTQPARGDYFGPEATSDAGARPSAPARHSSAPHGPDDVAGPVEIATRGGTLRGRRPPHVRVGSVQGSDGGESELADTSRGPSPAFNGNKAYQYSNNPASPVDSIAGRFELYSGDYATPASGQEVFLDAQESVGVGGEARGAGGSARVLPQPLPTPGSDRSEFATPSPLSREEEARPKKEA